jgi:hypothetical protein
MIEGGFAMNNETIKTTRNDEETNLICELGCMINQQNNNKSFVDFHNDCELTRIESNISFEKIQENGNLTNSSTTINMDEEQIVYGYKELRNVEELCSHEVMTYRSTSPALTGRSSGCSQVHHDEQDVQNANCLNLEENISFGLCEENPSLQEMLETTNRHTKKELIGEISTLEGMMKQENDVEHNEMDLLGMHEERPLYESSQHFTPSPLNLEAHHGFQQDLESHSIKEMLDTTFRNTNHDFIDKYALNYGQCKGSIGLGSEELLPRISQQDLQQVIIKQFDLEESHLFAESIEDHGSKEMQESPMGSEGQDFLEEIMTCEGEGNEETKTRGEEYNVCGTCLEDLELNEKEKNTNMQSNMGLILDHGYEGCSTLNKHIDIKAEGKRYNCLQYELLNIFNAVVKLKT